jgi:hypothetical protein
MKKNEYMELKGGKPAETGSKEVLSSKKVAAVPAKSDAEENSRKSTKKTKSKKTTFAEKNKKIKDVLETDVDKLYELVRDRGIVKLNEASKTFKIDSDIIEEWGRILEEHKLVRLRYPPVGEPVLILKRFTTDTEKIKELGGKKLKPKRRVFIVNFIILVCFIVVVAFYTIKIPAIKITYFQAYLTAALIIIIGVILIWRMRKRNRHAAKGKTAEK